MIIDPSDRRGRGSATMGSAIAAAFGDGIVPSTGNVPTSTRQRSGFFRLFPRSAKPKVDKISGA